MIKERRSQKNFLKKKKKLRGCPGQKKKQMEKSKKKNKSKTKQTNKKITNKTKNLKDQKRT